MAKHSTIGKRERRKRDRGILYRNIHPDQLLLTESACCFIDLRQAVLQEREETGEYIAPGGIQTFCHNMNSQQH